LIRDIGILHRESKATNFLNYAETFLKLLTTFDPQNGQATIQCDDLLMGIGPHKSSTDYRNILNRLDPVLQRLNREAALLL
jgi:hypothetical protein